MQCRAFARQLAGASQEFAAHHARALIIGPGDLGMAQGTARSIDADPVNVLYDESHAVYDAYMLDKVFLSIIQQSAAMIIDQTSTIRFELKVANPMNWLQSSMFKDLLAALDSLTAH